MTPDELRLFVLEHAPSHVLLADLVSAGAEIERLKVEVETIREHAERAEDELSEVTGWTVDYLNAIASLITGNRDTLWTEAMVRKAAGLDAGPAGEGDAT